MRGTCVAILCLLGIAMVLGGPDGDRPPPPDVNFLLERFLNPERSQFVKGVIAGRCIEIYEELNIQAPVNPQPEGPETRKLSTLLARYLHRQKRGAVGPSADQMKALRFCFRLMFNEQEEP